MSGDAPRDPAASGLAPHQNAAPPGQVLAGRILVVDDETANVRLLERILGAAGYAEVRCTTDAREALPLVREFAPDLILLDLHMPHLDGLQVIAGIRGETAADTFLPVLVLSADLMQHARNRVLQAGAKDFLAKPFDRGEVLLRVGNLLHTRFLHLALQGQNERLEARVRQRTQELEAALDAAPAAARAKEQFLANMGHEVRTPLTALHGAVLLLRRMLADTAPAPARRMLDVAAANSERLARVVDDVLFLQALRSGSVAASLNATPLAVVIREVVAAVAKAHPGNGEVELRMGVPEALPLVETDPGRLSDLLRRLVENACRFTPAGSVTVSAAPVAGAFAVRVAVADTGIGISPEQLHAVFEPFEQADNSDTRLYGGVGLGLSIVRGLCGVIGARLEAESTPGGGSTFAVLLPGAAPSRGGA